MGCRRRRFGKNWPISIRLSISGVSVRLICEGSFRLSGGRKPFAAALNRDAPMAIVKMGLTTGKVEYANSQPLASRAGCCRDKHPSTIRAYHPRAPSPGNDRTGIDRNTMNDGIQNERLV